MVFAICEAEYERDVEEEEECDGLCEAEDEQETEMEEESDGACEAEDEREIEKEEEEDGDGVCEAEVEREIEEVEEEDSVCEAEDEREIEEVSESMIRLTVEWRKIPGGLPVLKTSITYVPCANEPVLMNTGCRPVTGWRLNTHPWTVAGCCHSIPEFMGNRLRHAHRSLVEDQGRRIVRRIASTAEDVDVSHPTTGAAVDRDAILVHLVCNQDLNMCNKIFEEDM
eukprot:g17994.t1